ncbi:phoenix [Paramisgurnus dabryanus]|uniref:phoenix n=1 Tax=Paramisgurnus dabryanus TaxID=90735 RepID=UPI0031F3A039
MASEDDTTQIELLEFGKNSEVIFETPSQDVVKSIDNCFKQFNRDASNHKLSPDSDSGDSLFLTQSVTSAVRTVRRRRSRHRSQSITDDSEDGREDRCIENEDDEYEDRGSGHRQQTLSTGKEKLTHYIPPKKTNFPFLLKLQKHQHLPELKHQILENAEVGGFYKCIKKIQEGYVNTHGVEMWQYGLKEDSDLDEQNSDHEVTVVDNSVFALNTRTGKLKERQKWLSDFILTKRIKVKPSEAQRRRNACLQSKPRRKRIKSKAIIPDSPLQSPSCSDAELSFSTSPRQLPTNHIRSDEKSALDGDHQVEETQELNSEVATSDAEEEDLRAEPDSTSFSPHQGGDVSNHTQDDSGSETLLPDEDEEENEDGNNQNMEKTSGDDPDETLIMIEDRNDDSDVTQIDSEISESLSKSGPGTPRRKGKSHPCAADETSQHSSQDISTSPDSQSLLVRGEQEDNGSKETNKLQNVLTDIDLHGSSTKCSDSQDASQSFAPHVELLPESEKEINHQKTKRKTMLLVHAQDADGEETSVIQKPSGPVKPVSDDVSSTTETADSPLFKHVGQSFLKRKRRKEEKIDKDSDLMQRDIDASDDIIRLKTARKDSKESREAEERTQAASVLRSIETAELSEETSRFSLDSDMTVISPVKKKKAKKHKLEEQDDAELGIDTQHTQDTESPSKRTKKKKKDKKMQDNDATISLSNESLAHDADRPLEQVVNDSIQATVIDHSEHSQKPEGVAQEPSGVVEHMERKHQSSLSESDEIIALKKASEPSETTCNLEVSDSTDITKVKKKKKVKRQDAEMGLDTRSVENVQEDIPESPVELKANDSINISEAHQPDNTQKSEDITRSSSPGVTILRSGKKKKKKKKKKSTYECDQHDSPNVNLDACSVSLFDEVAWASEEENGSTAHLGERPADVLEHLKSNAKAKLNDAKGDSTEDSYPVVQSEETVTPEMRKKKRKNKRHTDYLTKVNSDKHLVGTDRKDFGNSIGSSVSTLSEGRSKKTKDNEEIMETNQGACPISQAIAQTKQTDSNKAKKRVMVATLEDSGDVGRKNDIDFTNSNNKIISSPEVNTSDTPKMPERGWNKNRCGEEAENVLQSHKIQETEYNPKGDPCTFSAQDNSESQTDDAPLLKKKKRKRDKESASILDTQNALSQDETDETFIHNDDVFSKKKKKKKWKCIQNDY